MKPELSKVIEQEIEKMPSHFKSWVKTHLIEPRKIVLFEDFNCSKTKEYWLITDHTGVNDSGYRIIYSEQEDMFGLEMETIAGEHIMMGLYGDFSETVESM